jgi:hypothetical protein
VLEGERHEGLLADVIELETGGIAHYLDRHALRLALDLLERVEH